MFFAIPGLIVLSIFQFISGYKKELGKSLKGIAFKSVLSVIFSFIIAILYTSLFTNPSDAFGDYIGFVMIIEVPFIFIFSWIILVIVHWIATVLRKKKEKSSDNKNLDS
ncbi:hypothetical protein [Bacillus thuringiensis]|uniref:Uncharacterized protein n=1 Tax=Bacillus thuringiensis TaxID=1428 RepID=A0A9X6WJF1_BACTU|nr:hypothetical protein [Bacillus thuringiensis]PFJ32288.1 hypothetical protein COJ15_28885 [Bacillus thuringiensis]